MHGVLDRGKDPLVHMPPPSSSPSLHLKLLPKTFYLYQIPSDATYSSGLFDHLVNSTHSIRVGARFVSITRTPDEISIVGDDLLDYELSRHGVRIDPSKKSDWRCIAVKGPMELCELDALLLPVNHWYMRRWFFF